MSQHLDGLAIGDSIDLTYPFGKLNYKGKKVVALKKPKYNKFVIYLVIRLHTKNTILFTW